MKITNQRQKIIISIILLILIVGCYSMIFLFSAENADKSSALSRRIAEWLVNFYHKIFPREFHGINQNIQPGFSEIELAEQIIRKLAHFTEYMILGILSYLCISLWLVSSKISVTLVAVQLFVSAGFDELHQWFVPGRYASFKDVLLDTVGGITGVLLVILITGLYNKKKRKRVSG